jgi:hypothetical protein
VYPKKNEHPATAAVGIRDGVALVIGEFEWTAGHPGRHAHGVSGNRGDRYVGTRQNKVARAAFGIVHKVQVVTC